MATIRESLLANVITTLKGIRTENGYAITIPRDNIYRNVVEASRSLGFPLLYVSAVDTFNEIFSNDQVVRTITITIELVIGGEQEEQPEDLEQVIGAVYNAMAVDPTRGGFARYGDEPEIQEPTFSQVFQDHASIRMVYPIEYCVKRTNASQS